MLRRILAVLPIALLVLAMSADASAQSLMGGRGLKVSAFGVYDTKSEEKGVGVSLSSQGPRTSELSALLLNDTFIVQSAQLTQRQIGMLPVYMGLTAGWAFENDDGTSLVDRPEGFMTGLQVVLAKSQPSSGMSLDLRASTMSEGANPIDWFKDPDLLWIGAGVSFNF